MDNFVDDEPVTYSLALEQAQFGKFKYAVLIVSGLVIVSVSAPGSSLLQSRETIVCNLAIDRDQRSKINLYTLLALMSGSLFVAVPTDLKSRVKPLWISSLFYGSFTLALGFCNEFYCFGSLSALRAFWASALLTTNTVYLAETMTPTHRASGLCILPIFSLIGHAVVAVSSIPWRISQFVFGTLALILSIFIIILFAESPRLLLSLGNNEAANDSLRKIHRRNYIRDGKRSEAEYRVKNLIDDLSPEGKILNKFKTNYVTRYASPPWYSYFVTLQIQFVFNLCYFTMKYWFDEINTRQVLIFPTFANTAAPDALDNCKFGDKYLPAKVNYLYYGSNGSSLICDENSIKIDDHYRKQSWFLFFATLPILLFMILRIDRIGRTFFTVSSHVVAGLLSFFVHYFIGTKYSNLYTCLMETMMIISGAASSCLANEIFKTRIRALGVGLSNSLGYLGMAMGIYGLLLSNDTSGSRSGSGNCIAVISLTGIIVTAGGLATLSLPNVIGVYLK